MKISINIFKGKEIALLPILLSLFLCLPGIGLWGQGKAMVAKETQAFRNAYKADFLKEERSPFYGKAAALELLSFYPAKAKYRLPCQLELTPDAAPFPMATYSGQTRQYVQYGWLHFDWKGQARKIAVYQSLRLREMEEYKDHLFVPFKDFTNDRKTYGGGRYIDLEATAVKEGKIVLDFNQSYNPYCAFSDGYSCPVPPKANHLEWAVKAGEKKFKGKH